LVDVGEVETHSLLSVGFVGEHAFEAFLFGEFSKAFSVDFDYLVFGYFPSGGVADGFFFFALQGLLEGEVLFEFVVSFVIDGDDLQPVSVGVADVVVVEV